MLLVAVIGGTGDMGFGLATRLAANGAQVIIGSRDPGRAREAAERITEAVAGIVGCGTVQGLGNREAAAAAEVVVIAVPPAAQVGTLESIVNEVQGKVVIDTTVATAPGDPTRVAMPPEGASALVARRILGDGVKLAAGFHTVSGRLLKDLRKAVEVDVPVAGDDAQAKAVVSELAALIGSRAVDVGPLENAGTLERITAMVIGMNIRLKKRHIGVRFVGL